MTRLLLVAAAAALLAGGAVLSRTAHPSAVAAAEDGRPRYDASGRLIVPPDYRDWVFLSSGIDMNYVEAGAAPTMHVFGNVFAPRSAYRRFAATGHWPDKTVLILENRAGGTRGSINKSGRFQTGDILGLEAHVRDVARFKGGWGFFAFDGAKPAERIGYDAACYGCHRANAAVDTTFVQFYPTLLPVAIARGSLTPSHRADPLAVAR